MNEKQAYHLFFSGRVQGVCFRMTTESIAKQHKVNGWVRNLPDGRVEAYAQGDVDKLNGFLSELKSVFRNNIIEYTCNEHPFDKDIRDFRVKY